MTDWREMEIALAIALGWQLYKCRITSADPAWKVYKSMRGPKWYVAPPNKKTALALEDTKEEALDDLPRYSESLNACREVQAAIPALRSLADPREIVQRAIAHFEAQGIKIFYDLPVDPDPNQPLLFVLRPHDGKS